MGDTEHPCRVCLSEGTWNIFGVNVINDEMCTIASINHIRAKLEYVTQLQVTANDGLPFRICELCIIQLNLAYRFKQLAADSDSKLRELYHAKESSEMQDALTCVEVSMERENPAELVAVTKQEQVDVTDEIDIGPTVVSEPQTENYFPLIETNATTDTAPAMVYLQKDIFNRAEDEAFVKDLLKKETIALPWRTISETPNPSPSPTTTASPKQTKGRQKPRKTPPKRRHSATDEGETYGVENRLQKQPKVEHKKEKRRSTPAGPEADPDQTSTAAKERSKRLKAAAALRKKRLQKLLESLRIDMVEEKLRERSTQSTEVQQPLKPITLKRRNSICVSSVAPWML